MIKNLIDLFTSGNDSLDNFFKAIKNGNLNDVKNLFQKEFVNEISEGGKALHWAVMHNNKEIVKFLLTKGFKIEDETSFELVEKHVFGKARAIHIAAQYGDPETISVLIKNQCKLDCVNNDGETPLDIAIRFKKYECVEILRKEMIQRKMQWDKSAYLLYVLKNHNLSKVIDTETGDVLLDKLLNSNTRRVMDSVSFKRVDEKEINDWKKRTSESYRILGECLYQCILQEYQRGFMILCTPDMVNRDSYFVNKSTVLEDVVQSQIISWVSHVLMRSYDINEAWNKAETIAKEMNLNEIENLIKSRRNYLNRKKMRGFSRLHIAVYDNAPEMIDYLLDNNLVNPDDGNGTVGSALSLAYELDYQDCIDCLHKHNVNTNTVDWLKRCPLTMAISNRNETDSCDVLINNIVDIDDTKDYTQLTVVHRSILNDCEPIFNKLLEKTLDCTKCVDMKFSQLDNDLDVTLFKKSSNAQLSHQETIFSLCFKANRKLYPRLLDNIDNSTGNLKDGDGNTLLHLSATCLSHVICSELLSKNVDCNIVNGNNNTPLMEMLIRNYDRNNVEVSDDMLRTVRVLITGGSLLNIKSGDNLSVYQIATKYNNEKLLLELICESQELEYIERSDFEIWLRRRYFDLIRTTIPLIDNSQLSQWITVDIIKSILDTMNLSLVKEIYNKAEPNVKAKVVEILLNKAAVLNDTILFDEFIKTEISAESVVDDGQSLLSYLIREKKQDFIDIVFESTNKSFLLRRKDRNNSTPLHVCIECQYWTIINHFFTEKVPVDEEDNDGYTPLALLFTMISNTKKKGTLENLVTQAEMLIKESADINRINRENRTSISFLRKNDVKQRIERYFQETKDNG